MTDYAMFTDAGNAAVHAIATMAQEENWTWFRLMDAMEKLSKIDGFGEATDTAVREALYFQCGYDAVA